ncbi:MAG: tRNA (adenosine(37)-N6)-threonylcarbamoyltransferase complex transferase subunit TsaD [Patescibacteria group bacterium]
MRILSIETSCDETAIAILEISGPLEKPEIKILGNTLLSQAKLHEEFGGVFPALAKREHQKNLPPLLEATLKQAGENAESPSIDFIAVTTGPGLEPALWTGIVFAKELGEKWGKPVIAVNHMEGHIFSVLNNLLNTECLTLPALALLVSGGHTELVHVKGFGNYEIMGRTVDDAVGEAYDKVARMLGLTYPGGPKISALAELSRSQNKEASFKFPRPMIHSGDLNFSYSGLKTAVLYKMRDTNRTDDEFKQEIALAFEDAAIEVLVDKTRSALEQLSDIKTLIVAGGVSANAHLQKEISNLKQEFRDLTILLPEKDLSTDNAIMIAIAGYIQATLLPEKLSTAVQGETLVAKGNLSISSISPQS